MMSLTTGFSNVTDGAYEEMREAGAIDEDPVEWAEDVLLIESAKELLLG